LCDVVERGGRIGIATIDVEGVGKAGGNAAVGGVDEQRFDAEPSRLGRESGETPNPPVSAERAARRRSAASTRARSKVVMACLLRK
jgi:hypothetical protein